MFHYVTDGDDSGEPAILDHRKMAELFSVIRCMTW